MNSKIYGNKVNLPDDVLKYLEDCFNTVPNGHDEIDGYRRNIELRNSKCITYQQLKRIKNWFDQYQGDKTDAPFILNGADFMKTWVGNTLDSMRNSAEINSKEFEPEYIEVPSDDFIDISTLNRPSKSHKKSVEKYDSAVTESLKRINQIMKKLI